MVTGCLPCTVGRGLLLFLLALVLLPLAGCATQQVKVSVPAGFKAAEHETVYVAPFVNTLVPELIAEPVFNNFVDDLNRKRTIPDVKFFAIIKDDLKDVDQAWLEKQAYITGELWSYIENSGCCSTEIRIKSRVNIHMPGQQASLEIFIPKEIFFEHDKSSIDMERARFARELSDQLSAEVLKALSKRN